MPAFSFVIPVYNGAAHVGACLESILSQTFGDIEVLCVDDASTDGSRDLLRAYARKDARVRVIELPRNGGSARARRSGVLASEGDCLLFADQDDSYEPHACEAIQGEMGRSPVDILQFGTRVVNEGGVEQGEIDGSSRWLEPYGGRLSGRSILVESFVKLNFAYTVWNKAYDGRLARRAFAALEDAAVPLGEDNYESFALFFFAESFRGMPEKLYRYHYGRGYTGRGRQSAASFKRTCGLVVAADLIRRFLREQESFDECAWVYEAARRHMLRYSFDRWAAEVPAGEQTEALGYLLDAWPFEEVLSFVAAERPRDLPALLDARFGPLEDQARCEGGDALIAGRRELEGLVEACRAKDERVAQRRRAYEASRAYRLGRALAAPLRGMRKLARRREAPPGAPRT